MNRRENGGLSLIKEESCRRPATKPKVQENIRGSIVDLEKRQVELKGLLQKTREGLNFSLHHGTNRTKSKKTMNGIRMTQHGTETDRKGGIGIAETTGVQPQRSGSYE